MDKNHANDIAVAISGLTPAMPNKRTNAPSLNPIPEIEIGSVDIVTIIGKKIKKYAEINMLPQDPMQSCTWIIWPLPEWRTIA